MKKWILPWAVCILLLQSCDIAGNKEEVNKTKEKENMERLEEQLLKAAELSETDSVKQLIQDGSY